MQTIEAYILGIAILLILCVFASKASGKLGIPTLVVFLCVGILAGSEGLAGIDFDDARSAQSLGVIALSYILFSGGLDTRWKEIKPILRSGFLLSTLGVLLTCLLVGSFIHFLLGFAPLESYLIGAIVSSTDAGAVFTVLRTKNIHLKGQLKPLLELESGSNDPMAVFLTTTLLQMMQNSQVHILETLPLLGQQMVVGGLIGFFAGKGLVWLFNRIRLEIEGLYIVLSIAIVIFVYSATQYLKGNGFLAVYIAGVVLGNHTFVFKKSLAMMHDGLSWLMQSAMFLTLGLLVYPSRILSVAGPGIMISSFMILFARPISVFISLIYSGMNFREKSLVSWVGLRGSVPVILATYPLVAGIDRAGLIFNIVFFVALSSLIFQGTTITLVARLLKVEDPHASSSLQTTSTPGSLRDIVTVDVPDYSSIIDKTVVDLSVPGRKVLLVAIEREGQVIIPRGSTIIKAQDKLSLMADDDSLADFVEVLWARKDGSNAASAQKEISVH